MNAKPREVTAMKKCRICKKELTGKGVMLHGYTVHPACKERYLREQTRRELREENESRSGSPSKP